ncbi:MAG: S4 domain-containing protein [Gemmatimonadota bacterium]|nr:S4 domain-containing protein [Gemmatimonadota bacterium]
MTQDNLELVRLDKWLWAARFFKTRAMAAEAIDGGKVQLNGARVKRSKSIQIGDSIRIRKGPVEYLVTVQRATERRVAAKEVEDLYSESDETKAKRQAVLDERRALNRAFAEPDTKPTKRDRRIIRRFKGKD